MHASSPLKTVLHLLMGAQGGGCERNCLLFCEHSHGFRHAVMTLGPAGEMTAPWQQVVAEVRHLDILNLPRPARAKRVRTALGELSEVPAVVMLWHGMLEMPFLLHALRDWCGPVFAHAGNPQTKPAWLIELRFLVAERLWPSPHQPTFVCCSEYVSRSLRRSLYLRRFSRETVLNGVRSLGGARHQPRPIAAGQRCIVGMLARLDWIKDHATVLRAVTLARQSLPGLQLEFAGEGAERTRLETLAAELGVSDAVRFLGNTDDVAGTIARWDVFVYATSANEGFGNALAEALTYGLPAIVTDVGPMREVCGGADEAAAVYIPPGDPEAMAAAMVSLLPDLPLRQALGESASQWAVTALSAEVYTRRYQQLFTRALWQTAQQ